LIIYRKLINKDINLINNLILNEKREYDQYLNMGWSLNQIVGQLTKKTNFSFGAFYNNILVSFVLGDLFNIEKISEYEILLIYVRKIYRKKGIATKLIRKLEVNSNCLKKIYLEVSNNNHEAISFYKKMNFSKVYIRKDYFISDKKKFDAIAMHKSY